MDRRERMEAWLCITLSENKSNITGIQYEPWHIRYVGLPHSAIMQKEFHTRGIFRVLKEEKRFQLK